METNNRAPLANQATTTDKRLAGATEAAETPLEIRNLDGAVDAALHDWVHERLGRQLGKYATQIERVEVRFGDENGPKGGVDRNCMIHIVLSALAPIVVEVRAAEDREAFDLAAGRAERALNRTMQKHGFSTKHKRRQRTPHGAPDEEMVMTSLEQAGMLDEDGSVIDENRSLFDRRVGRGPEQMEALQQERGAAHGDGAGPEHTATRNTKLHTSGMAYALEDSTDGKPSRKSTRGGKNHIKHDNGLTVRTKSAVHSPSERHLRAR